MGSGALHKTDLIEVEWSSGESENGASLQAGTYAKPLKIPIPDPAASPSAPPIMAPVLIFSMHLRWKWWDKRERS